MYAHLCLLRRFKRPSALNETRARESQSMLEGQETPHLFLEHKRHDDSNPWKLYQINK